MQIDKEDAGDGDVPSIVFRLDPVSGVPTYLQLVQQVESAVRLGYVHAGDRLPRVREVVSDLAINPNTVLKAYRELGLKGLVAGRPGLGTFVHGSLEPVTLPELASLRRSLRNWVARARGTGLDDDGIVALMTSTMRDLSATTRADPPGAAVEAAGGVA